MEVLRRSLQVLLLLATLLVGAAALAIVISQTAWFRDWLRGVVVREANQYLNGTLSIGRLNGNLFFGLEIADLGILQGGRRVVAVRNVGVDYSVVRFVAGDLSIDHIRLDQPRVLLQREAGKWNLSDLVRAQRQETQRKGPGRSISIGEIGISDGRVVVDRGQGETAVGTSGAAAPAATPSRIDRIDARFSFAYEPVHYSIDVAHLSFRTTSPDLALNALSGKFAVRDDTLWLDTVAVRTAESSVKVDGRVAHYLSRPRLDLQASSDKLAMSEVGRVFPALAGIPLQPSFRVTARGPLDDASFDFAVKSSAGDASGKVRTDLLGPERRIAGVVHLAGLDLAPITRTPAATSRITGVADIDIRFPSVAGQGPVTGTFTAKASEATVAGYGGRDLVATGRVESRNLVTLTSATGKAYGASGTAAGTIQPSVVGPNGERGVALDLHGAVSGLDLRNLPRSLKVPPAPSRLSFSYQVSGVGARLKGGALLTAPSTLAGATLATGTAGSFSNVGPQVEYGAEGSAERLDLRSVGRAFGIDALDADRFTSALNGRFKANGRGTSVAELGLDGTATLSDSTLTGTRIPSMDVEAHIANGAGRFRANGQFADLDPAVVSGDERLRGQVSGKVNGELGMDDLRNVNADTLSLEGVVSLSPSKVGELAVQRGELDGEYRSSTAHVVRLDVAGPDAALNGQGTLALGATGDSNFRYRLESPKLAMIGRVVGQPIVGAATAEGTVTGNRSSLRAAGTLTGSNVGYGDNRALNLSGRFTAAVPDFSPSQAAFDADLEATLLKVGGAEINQLLLKGRYAGQELQFDATARSVPREAHVTGTMLLHTDHREVHLTGFDFRTQGLEWVLPADRQPVVNYAGGRVTVKGLRLTSGPQAINAEGVIDERESDLRFSVTDVDLARLDTWLVGERRLGGILNAGARVTGPRSSLLVNGDFSIDGGAFRDFRYETLGGTVNYTNGRVALDVRLFQSPQAWVAAKGTLPTALWSTPANAGAADSPTAEGPVDLQVDSSPIDLGLVQGFTGAITKASGTIEAHARVSGDARNPQMSGGVGITNGAFTLPASGVGYRALNGRIDLEPGRAVFNNLSMTDDHGNALTVTGDVRMQGKELGTVALTVGGRRVEVLHNDLGRVAADADVTIGGRLQALRVEGTVTLQSGQVNIDRVLDVSTSSAYSTRPENSSAPLGPGSELAAPRTAAGRSDIGGASRAVPQSVGPVPLIGAVQPGDGAAIATRGGRALATGPYDNMLLDVRVSVPSDLLIKGKDLKPGGGSIGLGDVNVTLGGDVRLEKRPGHELQVLGQVTTVRGTYDFQGRRFDIQRDGRVRFEGVLPLDPALDITATRAISGVETRVHVGGTARRPSLTLTSRPPLDQADILALIVFNQPANQLGEGQQASLAERAGALATGFVASKLADSIGRALNLDTFEIQTAPESSGGQGAQVTVGEQLGQRLFVRLTQGVGAENLSQFVLEYELAPYLRLQTTVTQGDSATRSLVRRQERTGVDLIFFFSY